MANTPDSPLSLYGTSREMLEAQEHKNEILAEMAGEEYTAPDTIPKGKYAVDKRMLEAAQRTNELLENALKPKVINNYVTPEMYGAKGDGETDDTTAIQNAFNAACSAKKTLYFPAGTYIINSSLDFSNTAYYSIVGEYRQSIIKAGQSMEYMIKTGNEDSGVYAYKEINDICLDGDDKAEIGIYGLNTRYTKFNKISIKNIVGTCLVTGYWVNRITSCDFSTSVTGIEVIGTVNNLIISENNFNNLDYGMKIKSRFNDIQIQHNAFDTCAKCAIKAEFGGTNLTIIGNYFEACGDANGVAVETYTDTITMNGTLIFHGIKGTSSSQTYNYYYENLIIENNIFASCYSGNIICASHLCKTICKNNAFTGSTPYEALIKIMWVGANNIFSIYNYFEYPESTNYGSITKPIIIDVDNIKKCLCKIKIKKLSARNDPLDNDDVTIDLMGILTGTTPTSGTITEDGIYNTDKLYKISQDFDATFNITLSKTNIRGKYCTIDCVQGGETDSTGAYVYVTIDGTQLFNIYRVSNGELISLTEGIGFYIPSNANTLTIRVKNVYTNKGNAFISDLRLVA